MKEGMNEQTKEQIGEKHFHFQDENFNELSPRELCRKIEEENK
jgi:hypothetical protein